MDAVAGVASVTQLAVYSQYAAKYLLQLYSTARDALSLVKCQQEDILVLLQVIYRLNSDNSSLDSHLLLPVLIHVIDIARTLSNWLNESGVLGIKWTLVKRRSQIDDALKTLKQKSDLLGLYLVERNHTILLRIETSLNKETRDIAGSIENMNMKRLRKKIKVMNSASASEASASQSSAGRSSAGQSSTSQSLVERKHMDEGTGKMVTAAELQLQPYHDPQPHRDQQPHRDREPYRDEQPQHLQPQYQQYPSTTQSNNQTPQDRQRTTSKLKICGNKLDMSHMSLGNGSHDRYREFDIDCSNNIGKKATYIAFNRNEGDEHREEERSEVSQQSSQR